METTQQTFKVGDHDTVTRKAALTLIYRHTHRDFKATENGTRYVLVLRSGGTHSVPVESLTDVEIAEKLPHCLTKELARMSAKVQS